MADEYIEGTLVRIDDGETRQSINICTPLNEPGFYRERYIIEPPNRYLTIRDLGGCKTLQQLVRLVESRGGFKVPPSTLNEIEGKLVVLSTGTKSQTVNICRSLKRVRPYESVYVINEPEDFLASEAIASCRNLEQLVRLVKKHGGRLRAGKDW